MRMLWSVVFVLAACGGGNSDKAADKTVEPIAPAMPAPTSKTATEDAAKLNEQGKESMFANKYDDAEVKFRSALALDPKPLYAFNLCVSQYSLGKFGEANQACKTASTSPDAAIAGKANKMLEKIANEAKAQGVTLPP